MWGVLYGTEEARGGKEVKEGFLELESLSVQIQMFSRFLRRRDNCYYLNNTGTEHLWEGVPIETQNIPQGAQCYGHKTSSRPAFLSTLYLDFGESCPSEGQDKETEFIEWENSKDFEADKLVDVTYVLK